MPGRLLLVATPIGNLDDLSPRAARALAEAERVACEDTRHSGRLLAHLGLKKRLVSLHEHNERERVPRVVERLRAGATVALASDAGTPLVSDPGAALVGAAVAAGIEVVAVPGPCAAIAALTLAALPAGRFAFEGFLPPRAAARRRVLQQLARESRTLVFYEAPHRLRESLDDLPHTVDLARRTQRVIRQNLAWSIGYNLAALPLAALGFVPPWLAAIGMSLSSVVVVLNAMRLSRGSTPQRRPGWPAQPKVETA